MVPGAGPDGRDTAAGGPACPASPRPAAGAVPRQAPRQAQTEAHAPDPDPESRFSESRTPGEPGNGAGGDWLEQQLLAVARGDQDAFASLYTVLFPLLRAVIQRHVRGRVEAEDVAQDVMAELWTKAGLFLPGRGSARGWVVTIARRRAMDRVRHDAALVRREQRAADLARLPVFDSVQDAVHLRLECEELRRGMAELTELQREALRLAFFAGCTGQELAELLGVPLATAKSRLRSGLARLRHDLSERR